MALVACEDFFNSVMEWLLGPPRTVAVPVFGPPGSGKKSLLQQFRRWKSDDRVFAYVADDGDILPETSVGVLSIVLVDLENKETWDASAGCVDFVRLYCDRPRVWGYVVVGTKKDLARGTEFDEALKHVVGTGSGRAPLKSIPVCTIDEGLDENLARVIQNARREAESCSFP